MKTYYLYILANRRNGTLYIGVTGHLIQRIQQHKTKLIPGFTAKYNLNRLVYVEAHTDVQGAIRREKQMKKWRRAWKVELIEQANPEWLDLFGDIIDLPDKRNRPGSRAGLKE